MSKPSSSPLQLQALEILAVLQAPVSGDNKFLNKLFRENASNVIAGLYNLAYKPKDEIPTETTTSILPFSPQMSVQLEKIRTSNLPEQIVLTFFKIMAAIYQNNQKNTQTMIMEPVIFHDTELEEDEEFLEVKWVSAQRNVTALIDKHEVQVVTTLFALSNKGYEPPKSKEPLSSSAPCEITCRDKVFTDGSAAVEYLLGELCGMSGNLSNEMHQTPTTQTPTHPTIPACQ